MWPVVAALILATGLLGAPTADASSTPATDAAWVRLEGDMVVPAALAGEVARRADGAGYLTSPSMSGNLGSYDIRLVDSTGIESIRPEIQEAAGDVEEATGGDMRVASSLTDASEPAAGEILVVIASSSPCSLSDWIGCAGVQSMIGSPPNLIATSGKVWLHPGVFALDDHQRQHIVSHELGHALGLRHYDARHDGQIQLMHGTSYDALSFRSGDIAGLRFLHDGGPSAPSNDRFALPRGLAGALPTVATGTNVGASREPGEPLHAGHAGGASVWLTWTAPVSDEVTVELVSGSFDTVVGVYRGTSVDSLTAVASNDDGPTGSSLSAVRFNAAAGVTYRIAVDGADAGERGPFTLRIRPWAVGPFRSDVAFVERQYRDFLGADRPTVAELLTGVEALQSGDESAADLIVSLARHEERMASLAPVTRLYMAYFRRTPDTAGLRYWIGRHERGATLSSISSAFAASSEFDSSYGDLDDEEFVELVYRNVLQRPPDPLGEVFWIAQLVVRSRGWLMTQFSESSEHQRDTTAHVDVVSLRLGMLRAIPGPDVFESNVRELENGSPLQQIARRILVGDAYAARLGF